MYYSNISRQDRSLEYQAGGNNGTYAVIWALDWTCRKDERRCQKDFLVCTVDERM
jgi:hypothetical protein